MTHPLRYTSNTSTPTTRESVLKTTQTSSWRTRALSPPTRGSSSRLSLMEPSKLLLTLSMRLSPSSNRSSRSPSPSSNLSSRLSSPSSNASSISYTTTRNPSLKRSNPLSLLSRRLSTSRNKSLRCPLLKKSKSTPQLSHKQPKFQSWTSESSLFKLMLKSTI